MDYSNGKIYCIHNTVDEDIYIGSTCQSLSKRMADHRKCMNSARDGNMLLYQKMRSIGQDKFYIELIKKCECSCKEELRKSEGEKIRELKPVLNQRIEGRTTKEWYEDNEEEIRRKRKDYYNTNIETFKIKQKEYAEKNKEKIKEYKKEYAEKNKDKIKEYKKEYGTKNQEYIKEKSKTYYHTNCEEIKRKWLQKVKCECGMEITKCNLTRHKKSQQHQQALENLNNSNNV